MSQILVRHSFLNTYLCDKPCFECYIFQVGDGVVFSQTEQTEIIPETKPYLNTLVWHDGCSLSLSLPLFRLLLSTKVLGHIIFCELQGRHQTTQYYTTWYIATMRLRSLKVAQATLQSNILVSRLRSLLWGCLGRTIFGDSFSLYTESACF